MAESNRKTLATDTQATHCTVLMGVYQERKQKAMTAASEPRAKLQTAVEPTVYRHMCAHVTLETLRVNSGRLITRGLPRDHLCSSTLGNETQVKYLTFCCICWRSWWIREQPDFWHLHRRCSSRGRWHQTAGRKTMTHRPVLTFVCDKHLREQG